MLISRTSRRVALGLLCALLIAAGTAVAQDRARGRADAADGAGKRGRHRFLRGRGAGKDDAAARVARLQRLMEASDDQVRTALDASREAARVREEGKAKTAEVVVQAFREAKDATPEQRTAIRERTRARIQAIRAEARGPLTEAGSKVVASLTPEQRKKMDGAIKDRGLTFDEDRIALMFGMRLAHPWAEALLKARLEGPAPAPKEGK